MAAAGLIRPLWTYSKVEVRRFSDGLLWRRIGIVVVLALWLGLELSRGSEWFWSALAGGMLIYAVYTFFLTWPKDAPGDDAGPSA